MSAAGGERAGADGELSGAWNFRDVAELTGVRPGRFFRSSELSGLSQDGGRRLIELGVTDVADLRSPREVERRGPGRVPAGVSVHLLPFPDETASGAEAPHEVSFRKILTDKPADEGIAVAAKRFMTQEYQRFPTMGGARRAVRQVITLLAAGRPVIAHCFAGKDRTGFTVATVLHAVGVPREAVIADFLHSNEAVPQLRERIVGTLMERSGGETGERGEPAAPELAAFAEARLTDEVLGVHADYLDAAWRTIDDQFGSFTGFLAAAGVSTDDVARLRDGLTG